MKEKIVSKKNKVMKKVCGLIYSFCAMFSLWSVTGVAFADTNSEIKKVLQKMIDNVIMPVFVAIGVILSVYSVGQLVLAFKNEDADSKSRASTMLVVGVVLIAIPTVVSGLGLLDTAFGGSAE